MNETGRRFLRIVGLLALMSGAARAEGDTKTGRDGFDALYGKKTEGAETLPYKWIPTIAPNPHADAQWFRSAALGLFQHWGIVSGSPRGEAWDMRVYSKRGDKPVPEAEALKNTISPEQMFERAKTFNPTNYHPAHWMSAAKSAGFRYAVLTARHHDAFFLGNSTNGDWHAGHYAHRDLLAPWVEACRTNGIRTGFYFSGPDWYHGCEYQSYNYPDAKAPPYYNWKHEKVETLPKMPDAIRAEVKAIAHGQVRELLSKYGPIDLFWPDGGMAGFSVEEIRALQPGLIVGRGYEYATPEGWDMMKPEFIKEVNRRGYPWELCTIGHGGSWHWSSRAEDRGISAADLLTQLARVRANGGNLLVNIAPRPDGEMPHWFYPLCDELSEWMKTGAEAIYDVSTTGPFPYPEQCAQPVTVGPRAWYVFPSTKPGTIDQAIVLKEVGRPVRVTLLRNGRPVPFEHADRVLTLRIPRADRTGLPDVIKIVWGDA